MKVPVAVVDTHCLEYLEKFLFNQSNPVYQGVEQLFYRLGMDKENYGSPLWNPLANLVKPGQRVVIKPNLVTIRDREKVLDGEDLFCSSTHPAVLRPIIDYCWKALAGKGKIFLVDSPIEGSDFKKTVADLNLDRLLDFLVCKHKINVELLDLRDFTFDRLMLLDNQVWGNRSFNLGMLKLKRIAGDPIGYCLVDLKGKSNFARDFNNYSGLRFHRSHKKTPIPYHSKEKNLYSISQTVLDADLFINVPKLKTHKKTGVTLSLKSLVGITNRKYWLPHYQEGIPPRGDEYPQLPKIGKRILSQLSRFPLPGGNSLIINIPKVRNQQKIITEGCWSGNHTLWRTILDLNSILFYADKKGKIKNTRQRNYLTILDGIIGGEGDGPLRSSPKKCGMLIGGYDPVAVDTVATTLMGFESKKINHLANAENNALLIGMSDLDRITIIPPEAGSIRFNFQPASSWQEYLDGKAV